MLLRRFFCVLIVLGAVLPLCAETPAPYPIKAPLVFEPNRGQTDPAVRFVSRGNGHSFLLLDDEAVLRFADPNSTIRMRLMGQNPAARVEGVGLQSSVTNYFQGNDPKLWSVGVPHFAKVRYSGVYAGIDVVYYGSERQLEYDFEIQPFANPSAIQIDFQGAQSVQVGPEGDLILSTPAGEIRHQRPIAFQRFGTTQRPVEARFVLNEGRVGFVLGPYDRRQSLTIDPKLIWSTYLGGTGEDQGNDIAVDAAGNAYVVGYTQTVEFAEPPDPPPTPSLTPEPGNGFDAFVTKLDSSGNILFRTYFGGTAVEEAHSLALDSLGNIYVTGYTTSTNFPTTADAFQKTMAGVQDAYLVRLSNSGVIQYASFLGGSRTDRAFGVAVDSFNNAYVVGSTFGNTSNCTSNFPISNAFQPRYGCGLGDAFLTKVTPSGSIGFSTFLGGRGEDQAYDVAIDGDGNIIVTGYTSSPDFPVANALYRTFRGGSDDVFITKLNPSGTSLVFSTYLGGSDADDGVRLAVDGARNIYVTGTTRSPDFPLKNPPQIFHNGGNDAFLIKLHPDGQDADFSTFIGGEDVDSGVSVAVDDSGFIYVAGFTNSLQFYAINSVGGFLRGAQDGFLMKLSPDAQAVLFSTFLGGFGSEGATSVTVDNAGNAYVTGFTTSIDFPVASNAFQSTNAGGRDGFILKINADDVKASESYAFLSGGGVRTATAGQTANPVFGYVAVDVAAGSLPSGLEIIDLRSGGTLINEVSIPIPAPQLVGRLFASTASGSTTALTMVNPNDNETRVDFYFTPKGGETNQFGNFTLPAHAQVSSLLTGQPFNLPADLLGTVTYTSVLPLSTIGLLIGTGSVPTNAWEPIRNPYAVNNHPLTIPQFADGLGWNTSLILINPSEDTITGQISLFRNDGSGAGIPAEMATDQGVASVFPYSIEPRGVFLMGTRGESGDLTTGFVHIVPSAGSNAPNAYGHLVFTGESNLSTTVPGVEPGTHFTAYVETSGKYPDDNLAAMAAVALANSSDATATVKLTLIGLDGADSGLSATVTLPPKGHLSSFLNEIPGFENLPSPFGGILNVTTSQAGVAFNGFRARYNEQRQFLVTFTGPLEDVTDSTGIPTPVSPVIIPHLVDGGGYATQIVITSGVTGGAASGAIRYLNPSGKPLNVAVEPQ